MRAARAFSRFSFIEPGAISRFEIQRKLHNLTPISVSDSVRIVEVGPRDGLQNERSNVSVDDKVTLITKLAEAGCSYIEVGSFVSPKAIPAMANSFEVMNRLAEPSWRDRQSPNLVLACLVPTMKYFQQAIDVKAGEIAIFASASESFSQKNLNCSIEESIQRFSEVAEATHKNGISLRGYLSCVVECPYEGKIAPKQVAKVAEKLLHLGCREISLGDTIGVGTPANSLDMLDSVLDVVGNDPSKLAVHFHDTYGQALANILVSLERGISTVDSSVAGLGGCPYAKGATGNVATEDVVYMLNGLGVQTGIDMERLVEAGNFISAVLGRKSASRAGTALWAKQQVIS